MPDSTDPRAAERFRQWMDEQDRALAAQQAKDFVPSPARPQDGHNEKRDMPGFAGQDRDLGGQLAESKEPTQKVDSPFMARDGVDVDLDDPDQVDPQRKGDLLGPLWQKAAGAGRDVRQAHPDAARWLDGAMWDTQMASRKLQLEHEQAKLAHPDRVPYQMEAGLERLRQAAIEAGYKTGIVPPTVRQPIQIDRHDDKDYVERVRKAMEAAGKKQ